ncbi:KIF-binding protein [Coccinella septempunctata]|uniref:KIF-binding protein n=1 Tax=Coccinella septempunctata TaxID=41139 RepID=UPI001D077391|nr:KIF-binding protein [Coccinella septempunctata]
MTITSDTKESLNDLKEKYHKVVKLIKDESKNDPPNEPFLSKYAAKEILLSMKASIESLLKNQELDNSERKKLLAMLGTVHIFLGTIYIEIEDSLTAEKHLSKCLEVINDFKEEHEYISITLNAYNQFGILWFKNEPEKGKVYLSKSMELYEKNKNELEPPKCLDDFFELESECVESEESWKRFEKICTATYYYLAQIYGSLRDALKSAVYCHITLKRQLVYNEFEFIDWSLNAATLSQFFAEQKGFKQARHHLSAASYILDMYKKELDKIEVHDEMYEYKMEEFQHRSADVARCWAQYGSILLSKSKERLLAETEKDEPNYLPSSTDLADIENSDSTVSKDDLSNLYFQTLNLQDYEKQVTDGYVLTLSEAKAVFLNAQNWLIKSQEYYTLENLASDFIDINLSHSQLYLDLLFFDDNADNQAKYQKRRIDLMETVLAKINPLFYLSHCRKIWYEVGNAYINLLDIKLDKQRESNARPTANSLLKINNIITKGIRYFTVFLESFESKPNQIKDYLMVYARSQFYIGVLFGKFITLDKNKKLENTESSLSAYRQVIEFCEKYPDAKEQIMVEFGVCKEMVELLPAKICILKSEIANKKN